jgi:hypothetical protein
MLPVEVRHIPLLLVFLCACPRSGDGTPGGKLNALDANLVKVSERYLDGWVSEQKAVVRNGVVSPKAEVDRYLAQNQIKFREPTLGPFPITEEGRQEATTKLAAIEECALRTKREIETWFVRWEAYHKEDPACAIQHEAHEAVERILSMGDKSDCAYMRHGAWHAIELEMPGTPDCK